MRLRKPKPYHCVVCHETHTPFFDGLGEGGRYRTACCGQVCGEDRSNAALTGSADGGEG
jgi:hypothetical protein